MSPNEGSVVKTGAVVLVVCTQPIVGSQESFVQQLLSSQLTGPPGVHTPPPQVPPETHRFPVTPHGAVLLVWTQPEAGSHESSVQTLPSLQTTAAPGLQTPPPQVSPEVQALPSLHAEVLLV
jgi:hypothetical protein